MLAQQMTGAIVTLCCSSHENWEQGRSEDRLFSLPKRTFVMS